jgi:hypothetical protein
VLLVNTMTLFTIADLYKFVRRTADVKDLLGDGAGGLPLMVQNHPQRQLTAFPADTPPHYTALINKNASRTPCGIARGTNQCDLENPDVPLQVPAPRAASFVVPNCIPYRGLLHKRGYRRDTAIRQGGYEGVYGGGTVTVTRWPEVSSIKRVPKNR